MGAGIIVRNAGRQRPSQHFKGHFSGVPDPLAGFATDLVDGRSARLVSTLDVIPLESDRTYARVAIADSLVERCFVVAFRAIDDAERTSIGGSWDPRATPTLLADFHTDVTWDLYNCHVVDFQVWSLQLVYEGTLPHR